MIFCSIRSTFVEHQSKGSIVQNIGNIFNSVYEGFVTENEYSKRLDELFLSDSENDDLLYLEWETDIKKAIIYIRTHIDCNHLDFERFGRILMSKLKVAYINCSDIKYYASRMYSLWESLPGNIQGIEPFWCHLSLFSLSDLTI